MRLFGVVVCKLCFVVGIAGAMITNDRGFAVVAAVGAVGILAVLASISRIAMAGLVLVVASALTVIETNTPAPMVGAFVGLALYLGGVISKLVERPCSTLPRATRVATAKRET